MRFNSSSVSTRLKVLTILLDRSSLAIQTCTSWEDGNLGGTCEPFIHLTFQPAENRLAEGVVHIPDSARLGLEIAPQEVTQHSVRRNETLPIALESETCTPVTLVTCEGTEEASGCFRRFTRCRSPRSSASSRPGSPHRPSRRALRAVPRSAPSRARCGRCPPASGHHFATARVRCFPRAPH